jgi:hypothetical protein
VNSALTQGGKNLPGTKNASLFRPLISYKEIRNTSAYYTWHIKHKFMLQQREEVLDRNERSSLLLEGLFTNLTGKVL